MLNLVIAAAVAAHPAPAATQPMQQMPMQHEGQMPMQHAGQMPMQHEGMKKDGCECCKDMAKHDGHEAEHSAK